ncbi:flagellar hook-associated protein FlgK [Enterovibrio makurazakiensis]|uniref:Flagellar hook-associated protein 1 n=1 Tax=Enterovibrio gelatinilyticus TaxID=2899819 RepID=A0ABT5QZX3_9GAMM|nr:flagellar hook-associated protein FlgK [Enterovibrio sp. ZSDZ42]MDD1793565.1 flagellar hook-associated protein FlgK [Enterovibrio sp. ZSDZ42]
MSLFNIGLSGLNAANAGLSVTGHNITNAMTPGYSRQRVGFGAQINGNGMGGGVMVSDVERMSDTYLHLQIHTQRSGFGYKQVSTQYLSQTEGLLNSDNTSINIGLDRFYAALSEASAQPQDIAYRQTIVSQNEAMVDRFNNLSSQLENQKNQVDGQLNAGAKTANTLMASLASLNKSLREAGGSDAERSSLLDARDKALTELSSMMDISTTYNTDGTVAVSLGQGQPLVSGTTASKLTTNQDGELLLERGDSKFALNHNVGGTIGGLVNYRDEHLSDLEHELDVMAYSFATQFNAQHTQGVDLNGNPGKPVFGGVDQIEGAAKNLTLLVTDPKELAFAGNGTVDEPGNSDNLQALIGLKNAEINIDKTTLSAADAEKYGNAIDSINGKSLYTAYTGLSGDWAIKTSQSKTDMTSAESQLKHAENARESISGVNLDEEAVSLMQFTQMYQANSKVISTAQQLLDITMSMFN